MFLDMSDRKLNRAGSSRCEAQCKNLGWGSSEFEGQIQSPKMT